MIQEYKPKACHIDGQHVLTIGECHIHAGSNKVDYKPYQLIINVSNYSYGDTHIAVGKRGAGKMTRKFLQKLPVPKHTEPPELAITWNDGSVPDLVYADWMRLIDDLSQIKGKVLIHCHGGHGRTGTALVVLLALTEALNEDPVEWLRGFYCEKVVETAAQFKYLKALGIETKAKPSYTPVNTITQWPSEWKGYSNWKQEQYDLTKPETVKSEIIDNALQPLYKCILCQRKHVAFDFYQTFLDMTGFCWSCHEFSQKTNPDIQSA